MFRTTCRACSVWPPPVSLWQSQGGGKRHRLDKHAGQFSFPSWPDAGGWAWDSAQRRPRDPGTFRDAAVKTSPPGSHAESRDSPARLTAQGTSLPPVAEGSSAQSRVQAGRGDGPGRYPAVPGCSACPQNSCAAALTPSGSQCDHTWGRAFGEVTRVKRSLCWARIRCGWHPRMRTHSTRGEAPRTAGRGGRTAWGARPDGAGRRPRTGSGDPACRPGSRTLFSRTASKQLSVVEAA